MLTTDDVARLPEIAAALPEILAYRHQVFIALDYPEGFGDGLTEFLAQIPVPDQGIVRVLLLARFGGRWWSSIHPAGEIKYLIDRDPIQLVPLGSDPGMAAGRFSEAVQDYRLRVLGPDSSSASGAVVPAGLAEVARQHVTAIKLHALALVSVLHERDRGVMPREEVAWDDPLTLLVSHERKHWQKAVSGRLTRAYGEPLDGRLLLAPTLVQAYRDQDATAAVSRIPDLTDRFPDDPPEIAALLRDMYPPDGPSSLRWWSPLPLDRLGETLLAEVLADCPDIQTASDYIVALLGAADLPEAVQGLTVLARLNADPQAPQTLTARTGHCLDMLATSNRFRLLPALLLADRQVTSGSRTSERHLATLRMADAFTLVQGLERFSGHRLLQETGLILLDHVDRVLDTDEMRTAGLPEELRGIVPEMRALGLDVPVSTLAHVHAEAMRAQVLLRLGRAGEAVGHAENAARSMRAIFRASSTPGSAPRLLQRDQLLVHATGPSDQSDSLLHILDIYAGTLQAVGRLEESAGVRRECTLVASQRAKSGNPKSARTAAKHLFQLAQIQLELGQADQAEVSARDAVQLAHALPISLLTAETVTVWARALDRAGRPAEARTIAAEALRLHQHVAEETGSRTFLAVAMQALEHLVPQPASQADPLTELRRETLRDPAAATPVLVGVAAQSAVRLTEQGQMEEARQVMAEAIAQARRLAADDPDTYLEVLAAELMESAYHGLSADPVGVVTEAAEIFRQLVNRNDRNDLRMGLALSLQLRSLELRRNGRDEERPARLRGSHRIAPSAAGPRPLADSRALVRHTRPVLRDRPQARRPRTSRGRSPGGHRPGSGTDRRHHARPRRAHRPAAANALHGAGEADGRPRPASC